MPKTEDQRVSERAEHRPHRWSSPAWKPALEKTNPAPAPPEAGSVELEMTLPVTVAFLLLLELILVFLHLRGLLVGLSDERLDLSSLL